MKKLLSIFFLLLLSYTLKAQGYPISQSIGSDSTLVTSKGALKSRLINTSFTDTTSANLQRIKSYPGAQIFTTSDSNMWYRTPNANKWVQFFTNTSGTTGDTLVWKQSGNYVADRVVQPVLGTKTFTELPFITNDTTRMTIGVTGIRRTSSAQYKYVMIDTASGGNFYLAYGDGGSGSSYTSSNGITLTGSNFKLGGTLVDATTELDANSNLFQITNFSELNLDGTLINLLASDIRLTLPPQTDTTLDLIGIRRDNGQLVRTTKSSLTHTLQQVLTAGSTLTTSNTISLGGNSLIFSGSTLSSIESSAGQYSLETSGGSISLNPYLGGLYIDTLNYTLSTTGKKIPIRDTVTGLIENIDPALLGGGSGGSTSFVDSLKMDTLIRGAAIKVYGNSLTLYNGGYQGWPYSLNQYTQKQVFRSAVVGFTSSQIYDLFVADAGKGTRLYGHVFAMGRNDVAQNLATARTNILTNLQKCIDTLTIYNNNRWIIPSIMNGGGEGTGTPIHDTIIAINNYLAATYPTHYVDVRTYIVNNYVPSYPPDVTNYSQDIPGLSYRLDSIHLNYKGYNLWAKVLDSVGYNWISDTSQRTVAISANKVMQLLSGQMPRIGAAKEFFLRNQSFGFYPDEYISPATIQIGNNKTTTDTTTGHNIIIGIDAFQSNTTSHSNIGVGSRVFYSLTTGTQNVAVGRDNLYGLTTGYNNTAVGYRSNGAYGVNTGYANTSVGAASLLTVSSGFGNSAIGQSSQQLLTDGSNNTSIGNLSLLFNSSGYQNFAGGAYSLYNNTTNNLTSVGSFSMYNNSTGTGNVGFGHSVSYSNQTGYNNTAVGHYSQFGDVGAIYDKNNVTTLGYFSGYRNRGNQSIFIGSGAVQDTVTGNTNIAIGYNVELPNKTASNQLTIGNLIFATGGFGTSTTVGTGNVGIGINNPSTRLHVSGRFTSTQGADVASAAGAIALGTDGNTFEITGTNAITLISNVGWVNGSEITLVFTSTATLTDGTANSGTDIGMELAGNANFTASADDIITLVLCEIGGVQRFREKSRSVN